MKSLVILFSLLAACASLPPKPQGSLCSPDWKNKVAYCSDISNPDLQTTLPIVEMKVCVTGQTWENIVDYMNKLKEVAKQRCQ